MAVGVLVFSPIFVGVRVKVGVGWVGVIVGVSVGVNSGVGDKTGALVGVAKKLDIEMEGTVHEISNKLPIKMVPIFFI